MNRVLVSTLLLSLGCFQGCGSYWHGRVADLHEMFLYDAQAGVGLSADVRVSRLAVTAGASYGVWSAGKPTWWYGPTTFSETGIGLPFFQLVGALHLASEVSWQREDPLGWTLLTGTHGLIKDGMGWHYERHAAAFVIVDDRVDSHGAPEALREYGFRERMIDAFSVEAGAFALVGGLRFGFNLAECADFLAGCCGADLLGDDLR